MTTRRCATVALLVALSPAGASAQADLYPACDDQGLTFTAAPTLVANSSTRVGVEGQIVACWSRNFRGSEGDSTKREGQSYPQSLVFRLGADGRWAPSEAGLPGASRIGVAGGWGVSVSKANRPADRNRSIDDLGDADSSRGWIELVGDVTHEASSDWGEQNLLSGVQLRYGVSEPGLWRLMPSLVAHVEAVTPLRSPARDSVADPGTHARWGLRAYLNSSLDFLAAGLKELRVTGDAGFYRTAGLEEPLDAAGWDSGEFWTLGLAWVPDPDRGLPLRGIYLRYLDGEWPTDPTAESGVVLGVGFTLGG